MTRWKTDPWSRGSYSFVSVGASGSDYDVLAASVSPENDPEAKNVEGSKAKLPRLFFAGK